MTDTAQARMEAVIAERPNIGRVRLEKRRYAVALTFGLRAAVSATLPLNT